MEDDIRLFASTLGERLKIVGAVDDERLRSLIQASDCLVFPSSYEGFGLTLVEGLASGKPVVANDIPTYRSIVGELDVPVCDFASVDSLHSSILSVCSSYPEREAVSRGREFLVVGQVGSFAGYLPEHCFVMRRSETIGGIDLDCMDPVEVIAEVSAMVDRKEGGYLVTANVDHVVQFQSDAEFQSAYRGARLRLVDGAPVALLASVLAGRRVARVTGADLVPELCRIAAAKSWSVLVVGGPDGCAFEAARALRAASNGGLSIEGLDAGRIEARGLGTASLRLGEAIKSLSPDLVLLGLGAPKQELWAARHEELLDGALVVCCGAAVEFAADRTPRAPLLVRKVGLEWVFRLSMEPKRLWYRYLIRGPKFVGIAAGEMARSVPAKLGTSRLR